MSLPIQRLSYTQIGQIASTFLSRYHPDFSLPIPIEEIAEQKLGLKIFEKINLKKDYGTDGFLVSDLSAIFIDFDLYMNYENRSRFTIAHEVGHVVLHGDIFRKLNIKTAEDLYQLSQQITDKEHGWLEFQAYSFAGQVLVPKNLLFREIKSKLGRIPQNEQPEILFPVIQDLPEIFFASGEVILRRLQKEGIIKQNNG